MPYYIILIKKDLRVIVSPRTLRNRNTPLTICFQPQFFMFTMSNIIVPAFTQNLTTKTDITHSDLKNHPLRKGTVWKKVNTFFLSKDDQ